MLNKVFFMFYLIYYCFQNKVQKYEKNRKQEGVRSLYALKTIYAVGQKLELF